MPPKVWYHPKSKLVGFNESVYFWCVGLSTWPLSYKWETHGIDEQSWMVIKDSSNQELKLNAVQSSCQVRCKVSNDVGTVASNPATVTVFSKSCIYTVTFISLFLNRNYFSSTKYASIKRFKCQS